MRVIAGTAKRLELKTVPTMDTRPTTDRIKETLFNMISFEVADSRFLDLFSGSGAIGIEALSRGASYCVFVEQAEAAAKCIKENLLHTHLEQMARLMKQDVCQAIRSMDGMEKPFDIIFMDPPYGKQLEEMALRTLADSKLVHKDTLFIVEANLKTTFDYVDALGMEVLKEKKYKTNKHVFIGMKQ